MARKRVDIDDILHNIEHNEDLNKTREERESEVFENMRSFVMNPRNGVALAPFLSERIPATTSSDKLEEILDIICEKIFNPPTERGVYVAAYAAFCKGFGDIKVTKEEKGFKQIITFEEMLADKMLGKLEEKFSYKSRLLEQWKLRAGPEDDKKRWLQNQTENQKRKLRSTARISIQFLQELYPANTHVVYKIMEFILANPEEEPLEYLCLLLKTIGKDLDFDIAKKYRIQNPTAGSFLNDDTIQLNGVFRKISLLAIGNKSIPTRIRTMMQDLIKMRQRGWKTTSDDRSSLGSGKSLSNTSRQSSK